jgi:hypothetical protein
MPFSDLVTLAITEVWQVTPVTDGNFFRFTYAANAGFSYLLVAQAQVGNSGSIELFESRRFPITAGIIDMAQLITPPVINPAARRLAVRGLAPRSIQTPTLSLLIEASNMNVINPSASNTTTTLKTEVKQDLATMIEALPANAIRNGGIILNQGNKKMFLGFGVNADKGSKIVVAAGGQADIQANFTGVINLMWDAIDATAGNSSKAVFIEFVA